MYPPFLPQLPHQRVDPGEAGPSMLPAGEPLLGPGIIHLVLERGHALVVQPGRQMPRHKPAVRVPGLLGELGADGGLRGKVHVAEEQLPLQRLGRLRRGLGLGAALLLVPLDRVAHAPVQLAHRQGAKVQRGRQQGRGRGVDGRRARLRLAEGGGVAQVGHDVGQARQGSRLAAAVRRRGRGVAQLGQRLDGEVGVRAGHGSARVGGFPARRCVPAAGAAPLGVDVGLGGRHVLLDALERRLPRIRQRVGRRQRAGDGAHLGGGLLQLGETHGGFASVALDQVVAVPQRAAGAHDNLDAGPTGRLHDVGIAGARVGVRVLFEHEMGHAPGLEKLGEDSLGCFADDQELGPGVEGGDGGGEIGLAVEEVLPPVQPAACPVDIMRIPGEDGPEHGRVQCQGSVQGRGVVKAQVGAKPVHDTIRLGHGCDAGEKGRKKESG